jgi:replicative DNA helicase
MTALETLQAERQLLSAYLYVEQARERIPCMRTEFFLNAETQELFTAIENQFSTTGTVEAVGLYQYGIKNVFDLPQDANVNNFVYFERMVKDSFLEREIQSAYIKAKTQPGIDAVTSMFNRSEELLSIVRDAPTDRSHEEFLERLEHGYKLYSSHIPCIDSLVGGFEEGNFIIIAARPGTGKTALAGTLANMFSRHEAVEFFSYEMTGQELRRRLISESTAIPIHRIKKREFLGNERDRLIRASEELGIVIHQSSGQPIDSLIYQIRVSQSKIFFVDYLQLIPSTKQESRNVQVTEVSNKLFQIGKQTGKVIIALSQLNREADKTTRQPILSDLRDSGAIEQDANVVLFIHADTDMERAPDDVKMRLIVRKNRDGKVGGTDIQFNRPIARFYQLTEERDLWN